MDPKPLLVPLLLACCSCAVLEEENRHLVPLVEEHLVPDSTAGKVLAAPVVLPVGIAAGLLDAFIVHPITVIDDAYDDVADALWRHSKLDYVAYCGSLPFKAAATPAVFSVSFTGRAMFPIESGRRRRAQEQGRARADKEQLKVFRSRILSEDPAARRAALKELPAPTARRHADALAPLLLQAARMFPADPEFQSGALERMWALAGSGLDERWVAQGFDLEAELAAHKDPTVRRRALRTVRGLATVFAWRSPMVSARAWEHLIGLFDLYVKDGDRVSELMCCGCDFDDPARGYPVRNMKPRMALHVVLSWERRRSPDYAALIEFQCQSRLLELMPELMPRAAQRGWRAASGVQSNWPDRLVRLLRTGLRPKTPRAEAEELARRIIGERVPTEAERRKLLEHPQAVLRIAQQAGLDKLRPLRALEVRTLMADLHTEIAARDFVPRVARMSREDFELFGETTGATFTQPAAGPALPR